MFYIYILYSPSSGLYYTGYTTNIERRLLEHNEQEHFNTFTSKHRPWQLAALFECGLNEDVAIQTERFIKKQKSKVFLEKLIHTKTFTGALAHLVRVPKLRD